MCYHEQTRVNSELHDRAGHLESRMSTTGLTESEWQHQRHWNLAAHGHGFVNVVRTGEDQVPGGCTGSWLGGVGVAGGAAGGCERGGHHHGWIITPQVQRVDLIRGEPTE